MEIDRGTALLGGLSPAAFMRRHWQKKPLLVRAALAAGLAGLSPARLFELAARSDVESRLVVRSAGDHWRVRPGPLTRRALPAQRTPGWTLLVQGVDLHDDAAHALLGRFRFVPDARLDDVMVSFASDGGGVGPHVDSYDVFLLQLAGSRRWRVGRTPRPRLRDDVPLKMLAGFTPSHDWLLGPGDMLYLPPGWGHEGTAEGACLTASIGFRAPAARELGAATLQRVADAAVDDDEGRFGSGHLYRDPAQAATEHPARVPAALQQFADAAAARLLADRSARLRALGEALSEPKAETWFERGAADDGRGGVVVDRRTRMLYDDHHLFVNGEAFRAGGRDRTLMRRFADRRVLDAADRARLSDEAQRLVQQWLEAGWLRAQGGLGQNADP